MSDFFQVAGWTLIHFVWQGAALGVVAAGALRLIAHRSPNARYLTACLGMVMMLAAPLLTASASLLLNLEGVFTALLAWFVFHENFDRRIALGMVLIIAGGLVLSWQPQGSFGIWPGRWP